MPPTTCHNSARNTEEKAQRTFQGKKLKKEKPESTPVRMSIIESLIAPILRLFGWADRNNI